MLKKFLILITFFLSVVAVFFAGFYLAKNPNKSALVPQIVKEKARPLDKYTYEALSARDWQPQEIKIEGPLDYKPTTVKPPYKFKQYIFSTIVDGKKVTGQINIPNYSPSATSHPLILMFRGYAPLENYQTGIGTRPSASVFAQNGFITVAPDFLGYGGSDPRDPDEMTGRFESYVISLQMLKNLQNPKFTCSQSLSGEDCNFITSHKLPVTSHLSLFGHSNGGHLAIASLEIAGHSPSFAGQVFPTVLWAPVSKPFPFSVLAYEDEADDFGKAQRKSISNFENVYDSDKYSVATYLDWINSPIELHQGTADEEVPYWWSREFVKTLKEKKKDVKYFEYPGTNHNMSPASSTILARSLQFFQKHLK